MNSWTAFLMSENKVCEMLIAGVSAIGGSNSSGMVVEGLKSHDDYAILSSDALGVVIHPLKGKIKTAVALKHLESFAINDLRILVVHAETTLQTSVPENEPDTFAESLSTLTNAFSEPGNWEASLSKTLKMVSEQFAMEKGVLIARTPKRSYEIVASLAISLGDPWLSKTLVEETLRLRQPHFVHNLLGSEFENKKSLVATGFVSVFAWPLIVRGETLGVLLLGSTKPHSGLSERQQTQADTYAHLTALLLHFHLRDVQLKEEITHLRALAKPNEAPLLTQDPTLLETCRTAGQVAASSLAVLIHGETGVGKEVLAKWIHTKSDRADAPFVAVNCGAIPGELLESLLFGHRKGAFTGATQDHSGKFALANGGTIFLDEIGDLPEPLQVKLLRVLQEGQIEPLGGTKPISINVRVLAATHKSLANLIATGKFREDLYYRLAEMTLEIPSLRSRPKDIGLLATHFLKLEQPGADAEPKRFAHSAWQWMHAQEWRGNVRELASAVRRASILSSSIEIEREDFLRGYGELRPAKTLGGPSWLGGKSLDEARDRFTQDKIAEALRRSEGKRKEAAELLGVTTRTLFRYLEDRRAQSSSHEGLDS